jgi:threonine dehydrogenase-like Zn-dependent dehydrogenase
MQSTNEKGSVMRAAVFAGPGKVGVVDRPKPAARRPDDIVIEVQAAGLCGSDLRARATPPEMIYDEGVIVGHEFAGVVADAGRGATLTPGTRVTVHPNIWCQRCYYCRSGHTNLCDQFVHIGSMRDGGAAEFCVVPERMVYPLPGELPIERAALAEPLSCVLNGTGQAAIAPGESALIIGGGPIGLLYLLLFKAAGAFPVIVSEIAAGRARSAAELGADAVIDPRTADLAGAVRELTEGRGADVAVDAVGSMLRDAIMSVGKTGRVFTFGLNEQATVQIEPAVLAYKEISVRGVYIAKGTFPMAIRMLTDNRLGFDRLLTRRYPLDGIGEAIADLRSGEVAKGLLIPNVR